MKVSASQISSFDMCPRKWYLRSVLKMSEPSTPQQAFGTEVHEAVEFLLNARDVYNGSDRAMSLARLLVQAARDAGYDLSKGKVEQSLEVPSDEVPGVTFHGRLDWYSPASFHQDHLIVDWKTRGSLAYAPDAEMLASNPQALLYAWMVTHETELPVTFCHVNVAHRGAPETRVVRVTLDRNTQTFRDAWRGLIWDVEDMVKTAAKTVDDVQANFAACSQYGGCGFAEWCSARPEWPHKEVLKMDDLQAKLAARRGSLNPHDTSSVEYNVGEGKNGKAVERAVAQPQLLSSQTVAPPQPVQSRPAAPARDPYERQADGRRILLLGCAPLVGVENVVWADRWLAPMADEVAARYNVPHFSMVDYGKGKAELVGMVAGLVRAGNIPRTLVLDRRTAIGEAVVDVLSPAYDIVIGRLG